MVLRGVMASLGVVGGPALADHCGTSSGTWQTTAAIHASQTQYATPWEACVARVATENQAQTTFTHTAKHVTATQCLARSVQASNGAVSTTQFGLTQTCGNDASGISGLKTALQIPASSSPGTTVNNTGPVYQCSTGNCSIPVEVSHTHNIAWPDTLTGLSEAKVSDYMSVWTLFLVAAVCVLCAKALYNRFRIDTHEA